MGEASVEQRIAQTCEGDVASLGESDVELGGEVVPCGFGVVVGL